MSITIQITCHHCHSESISRNGKKNNGTQNYICKNCGKQFIANHERKNIGTMPWIAEKVRLMMVRGSGVRDISVVLDITVGKVLSVLVSSHYTLKPKKEQYKSLEIDEFWTYVGSKSRKYWLIYAYDREGGEVVAYVFGKRDAKTARKLRDKIHAMGIRYDVIATDDVATSLPRIVSLRLFQRTTMK
jgi:transposase-like protein